MQSRPVWNAARRELTIDGVVVKRFRQPAENQVRVLEAFEEEGWPDFIYDPLPCERDINARGHRLRDCVYHLNRKHINEGLLRFHTNGTGEVVLWERVEQLRQSYGPQFDDPAV